MAKPNYQYEKRQRDLARKRKQDEKRRRKLEKKDTAREEDVTPPNEAGNPSDLKNEGSG